MSILKWAFLLLLGSAILFVGGGTYLLFRVVLPLPEVPWWIKGGFALATLGLLLLLLAVVRDRLRAARRESFQEVEK